MSAYGFYSTLEGVEKVIADNFYLASTEKMYISSGMEYAYSELRIDGKLRVDGKIIAGKVLNYGTIKVEGTIEIDDFLE